MAFASRARAGQRPGPQLPQIAGGRTRETVDPILVAAGTSGSPASTVHGIVHQTPHSSGTHVRGVARRPKASSGSGSRLAPDPLGSGTDFSPVHTRSMPVIKGRQRLQPLHRTASPLRPLSTSVSSAHLSPPLPSATTIPSSIRQADGGGDPLYFVAVTAAAHRDTAMIKLRAACDGYVAAAATYAVTARLPKHRRFAAQLMVGAHLRVRDSIAHVRLATLQTIEAVETWQEAVANAQATASAVDSLSSISPRWHPAVPAFMWRGRDYLAVLTHDACDALLAARVPLDQWGGIHLATNPLLLPAGFLSAEAPHVDAERSVEFEDGHFLVESQLPDTFDAGGIELRDRLLHAADFVATRGLQPQSVSTARHRASRKATAPYSSAATPQVARAHVANAKGDVLPVPPLAPQKEPGTGRSQSDTAGTGAARASSTPPEQVGNTRDALLDYVAPSPSARAITLASESGALGAAARDVHEATLQPGTQAPLARTPPSASPPDATAVDAALSPRAAATRIQAHVRGHLARRSVLEKVPVGGPSSLAAAVDDQAPWVNEPVARLGTPGPDSVRYPSTPRTLAAVRIQAHARGYLTRRAMGAGQSTAALQTPTLAAAGAPANVSGQLAARPMAACTLDLVSGPASARLLPTHLEPIPEMHRGLSSGSATEVMDADLGALVHSEPDSTEINSEPNGEAVAAVSEHVQATQNLHFTASTGSIEASQGHAVEHAPPTNRSDVAGACGCAAAGSARVDTEDATSRETPEKSAGAEAAHPSPRASAPMQAISLASHSSFPAGAGTKSSDTTETSMTAVGVHEPVHDVGRTIHTAQLGTAGREPTASVAQPQLSPEGVSTELEETPKSADAHAAACAVQRVYRGYVGRKAAAVAKERRGLVQEACAVIATLQPEALVLVAKYAESLTAEMHASRAALLRPGSPPHERRQTATQVVCILRPAILVLQAVLSLALDGGDAGSDSASEAASTVDASSAAATTAPRALLNSEGLLRDLARVPCGLAPNALSWMIAFQKGRWLLDRMRGLTDLVLQQTGAVALSPACAQVVTGCLHDVSLSSSPLLPPASEFGDEAADARIPQGSPRRLLSVRSFRALASTHHDSQRTALPVEAEAPILSPAVTAVTADGVGNARAALHENEDTPAEEMSEYWWPSAYAVATCEKPTSAVQQVAGALVKWARLMLQAHEWSTSPPTRDAAIDAGAVRRAMRAAFLRDADATFLALQGAHQPSTSRGAALDGLMMVPEDGSNDDEDETGTADGTPSAPCELPLGLSSPWSHASIAVLAPDVPLPTAQVVADLLAYACVADVCVLPTVPRLVTEPTPVTTSRGTDAASSSAGPARLPPEHAAMLRAACAMHQLVVVRTSTINHIAAIEHEVSCMVSENRECSVKVHVLCTGNLATDALAASTRTAGCRESVIRIRVPLLPGPASTEMLSGRLHLLRDLLAEVSDVDRRAERLAQRLRILHPPSLAGLMDPCALAVTPAAGAALLLALHRLVQHTSVDALAAATLAISLPLPRWKHGMSPAAAATGQAPPAVPDAVLSVPGEALRWDTRFGEIAIVHATASAQAGVPPSLGPKLSLADVQTTLARMFSTIQTAANSAQGEFAAPVIATEAAYAALALPEMFILALSNAPGPAPRNLQGSSLSPAAPRPTTASATRMKITVRTDMLIVKDGGNAGRVVPTCTPLLVEVS